MRNSPLVSFPYPPRESELGNLEYDLCGMEWRMKQVQLKCWYDLWNAGQGSEAEDREVETEMIERGVQI